jgi:hypothetical protein
MISIIVCSRTSDIPEALKQNIQTTIGLEYELVIVDNSKNEYSIFQAYNEGGRRAKYPYLCFMHEDILFRTNNWGQKIIKHFEDTSIGLIGMAGTHFLPKFPSYWTNSPFISEHNLSNDNGKLIECFHLDLFKGKELIDVVACDGFCLFIRKELFNSIFFDEKNFDGFHYYDMDICMQVLSQRNRVCVCRDILIEHSWSNNYSKKELDAFDRDQQIFFDKWKDHLPIARGIDDIPQYVLDRLNGLYGAAYDAQKVRKSKAYKIGKFILYPIKAAFHLFK